MRTLNFAKRNLKELVRDPMSLVFAILLPLFLLIIFQQFKIPDSVYRIENFTPGIIVFSYSFISLFTATLIAKDRTSSLLARLYASPMKPKEYIFGYILSIIPIVLVQNVLFFVTAVILGLTLTVNIVWAILVSIPISILFIALGLIIGSITSEKASSGCGSIVVQLVAFTSGMYFPADIVGKTFNTICKALPFSRCLDLTKGILNGNYTDIGKTSIFLGIYIVAVLIVAVVIFRKRMIGDNK